MKRFLSNPVVILSGVLLLLCHPLLHPDIVLYSNDGPLGQIASDQSDGAGILWADLNYLGGQGLGPPPSGATWALRVMLNKMQLAMHLTMAFLLFFIIYYNPAKHFNRLKWGAIITAVPVVALASFTCVFGLLGYLDGQDWVLLVFPVIYWWLGMFGVCMIDHQFKSPNLGRTET